MNLSIKLSRGKLSEYFAEFLGTFFFMFVLYVSPVILSSRSVDPLVISFVFIILNITFGIFSKGHFNPIFSLADFLIVVYQAIKSKDYSKVKDAAVKLGFYLAVQLLAALVAYLMVQRMSNMLADYQIAAGGLDPAQKGELVKSTQYGTIFLEKFTSMAFALELFFSMILVLLYQLTANSAERKSAMPYVVGLGYFVFSAFAIGISGASFNPVRSLIAAIFMGGQNMANLWLYIVAPFLGAVIGSILTYIFTLLKPVATKKA